MVVDGVVAVVELHQLLPAGGSQHFGAGEGVATPPQSWSHCPGGCCCTPGSWCPLGGLHRGTRAGPWVGLGRGWRRTQPEGGYKTRDGMGDGDSREIKIKVLNFSTQLLTVVGSTSSCEQT